MPETGPRRPDERPEQTPERNVESAVRDTFPASDPVAATATQGARAVSPADMLSPDCEPPAGAVMVSGRFADPEAAKLAVEALVREVPIDRRCADIRHGGDGVTLAVATSPAEAVRVRELLAKAGATD